MVFEANSGSKSITLRYSCIERLLFLCPDTAQFVLKLSSPQTIREANGGSIDFSYVLLQAKYPEEKVQLRLEPLWLELLPQEFVDEVGMQSMMKTEYQWDCYEAMARALQWMCHRPLIVS
jgi:hypothetical protein